MTRRTNIDDRQSFVVEQNHLVRTVAMRDGRTYSHRCSLESYTAVAHYIEEHAAEGVTTTMLWQSLHDVPCTQASVALAFLKERGCLEARYRRLFPTSDVFVEDALIEFHALAELPPDLVREAEAEQREGNWSEATALWRKAAAECIADDVQARYLKMADWCDEMRAICEEGQTR